MNGVSHSINASANRYKCSFRRKISYMNVTATVKIKLDVTAEVDLLLRATQAAYLRALNLTSAVAFTYKVSNAVRLHHLTYRDIRTATSLPANLVCSARAIVAEAYQRELSKLHQWRDGAAVRYDARTCTLKLEHARARLTTIEERVTVSLFLADYQRRYLNGDWKIAATVTLCRRGRVWYLHLVAEKQVPDASGTNVLGVDSGINRIAFTVPSR